MSVTTMTITEFLLARIAEDEDEARNWYLPWEENLVQPSRVLAECEAKRRIVEHETARLRLRWRERSDEHHMTFEQWLVGMKLFTLNALASVYADHPDFRQEWAS